MVFYGVIKNLSCDLVALVHQNRQPQLFTSTISLHHFATVSFRTHLNCITSPFSWSSWWLFLKKSVVRKKSGWLIFPSFFSLLLVNFYSWKGNLSRVKLANDHHAKRIETRSLNPLHSNRDQWIIQISLNALWVVLCSKFHYSVLENTIEYCGR